MRMYFYLSLFSHHACKYAKSKNGYGLQLTYLCQSWHMQLLVVVTLKNTLVKFTLICGYNL